MNGGGGTPAVQNESQAPAQPAVPMQNYAAFSPGQQGLLAQQMQQGFGGSLLDQQNAMGFYQDMQVPQIQRPSQIEQYLEQIKKAAEVKKTPGVGVGGGGGTGGGVPEADGILEHNGYRKGFMGSNR